MVLAVPFWRVAVGEAVPALVLARGAALIRS